MQALVKSCYYNQEQKLNNNIYSLVFYNTRCIGSIAAMPYRSI